MPLTINIVGAGIAGLTAAIPLSQAGHEVHLFEKSSFSHEVGAALHFGPHVNKILRRWGFDFTKTRPMVCEKLSTVDWNGGVIHERWNLEERKQELGLDEDELLMHRVDAHTALREHALKSPNVHLHLSSGVDSVDPAAGAITLHDGSVHTGDVVVGADGVHSAAVKAIAGDSVPVRRTGLNLYRFMVQTERARADPDVSAMIDKFEVDHGVHNNILAPPDLKDKSDRCFVMYPCRQGSLLNCITFQSTDKDAIKMASEWTNPGKIEDVVEVLKDWPEPYVKLINLAEDVKHWALVTRDVPTTFVKDKLVLIGDAAHPIHPTFGSGAGMGVEDGAVLGAILDETATLDNLHERLALYDRLRYERTVTVKYASEMQTPERISWGLSQGEGGSNEALLKQYVPNGEVPANMESFIWPLDAVQQAKEALVR